ncbi:MAG: cytochrome C [Vicinamibacterales bacterium]
MLSRTRPPIVTIFAVGILALACSGTAFAGQVSKSPSGSGTYVNYCGSCHGPLGKGNGPMASVLTVKPADLTTIATRNGGKFPSDMVFRMIDGRVPVRGHGGQGMPVWGDQFQRIEGGTPEASRVRVEALVSYLASIQQK